VLEKSNYGWWERAPDLCGVVEGDDDPRPECGHLTGAPAYQEVLVSEPVFLEVRYSCTYRHLVWVRERASKPAGGGSQNRANTPFVKEIGSDEEGDSSHFEIAEYLDVVHVPEGIHISPANRYLLNHRKRLEGLRWRCLPPHPTVMKRHVSPCDSLVMVSYAEDLDPLGR
jgi:hypothetical protein